MNWFLRIWTNLIGKAILKKHVVLLWFWTSDLWHKAPNRQHWKSDTLTNSATSPTSQTFIYISKLNNMIISFIHVYSLNTYLYVKSKAPAEEHVLLYLIRGLTNNKNECLNIHVIIYNRDQNIFVIQIVIQSYQCLHISLRKF